jgi:Arc/MetJ-type ribon-helix-helix transcriptional regulator
MTIRLKPELAKLIDEQVKSGQFESADEAVNAAVAHALIEEELLAGDIDDEDLAAIEEGLAQLKRGEGIPWEQVRAEIEKKYLSK